MTGFYTLAKMLVDYLCAKICGRLFDILNTSSLELSHECHEDRGLRVSHQFLVRHLLIDIVQFVCTDLTCQHKGRYRFSKHCSSAFDGLLSPTIT